jgi:hypothetical protein
MNKADKIKEKYLSLRVMEDNIDYAIDAVKEGTKREFILETLMADYRGMSESQSTQLLNELFEAYGGEFKKENSGGYLFGTLFLLVGLTGAGFAIAFLISGEIKIKFLLLALAGALFGLSQGSILIYKSFRGKYRDNDSPL